MKKVVLRSQTCFLFFLSVAVLARADREADRRKEIIPVGHTMRPPIHKSIIPFASGSGPTGYTPQQLRHAYGFDQLSATGAGQTIAIVDAYGSPTMQADLDTFCAQFGIPSTTVAVYYPQGIPGTDSGWAGETSLDVEWAHAIAPGATIALVVAKSSYTSDLFAAVDYAVALGAKQISISWGGTEFSTESTSDYHFNVPSVSFFASSGDSGAGVSYPASSPYVVGVGGTSLHLDSSSNVSSETAWSRSGGGISAYEPIPSYQRAWLSGTKRGVPDVAYDADPATGVPVYQTGVGWGQYGGTSMSAPQWAALCALANSLRTQPISSGPSLIYSLADSNYAGCFRDITLGSNGNPASTGYDLVTGLGSPLANTLILALASPVGWTVKDFDGDSGADVLWRNATTGDFGIWNMTGTTPTGFTALGNMAAPWSIAAVGDFNHDGKADILWRNATTGEVGVMLMNGTSQGSYVGLGVVDSSWSIVGVGDFNDDGQTDILWESASGALGFWALDGTTVAGFTSIGTLPAPWTIAGVGDFNADGKSDLLWYDPTSGNLVVSLMNGATVTGFAPVIDLPSPWTVAGVADYNGDGSSDLLLRDPTTGNVGILLMNSATPTSFSLIGNVPAPWQPLD